VHATDGSGADRAGDGGPAAARVCTGASGVTSAAANSEGAGHSAARGTAGAAIDASGLDASGLGGGGDARATAGGTTANCTDAGASPAVGEAGAGQRRSATRRSDGAIVQPCDPRVDIADARCEFDAHGPKIPARSPEAALRGAHPPVAPRHSNERSACGLRLCPPDRHEGHPRDASDNHRQHFHETGC